MEQDTPISTEEEVQVEEGTDDRLISYTAFSGERVAYTQPEKQGIPKKEGQFYHQIPLFYNYGSKGQITDGFKIEGPEMTSNLGIQSRADETDSSKITWSVMSYYSQQDPKQVAFMEIMRAIYKECAEVLFACRFQVGMKGFNLSLPEDTGLKNPVHVPTDKLTGDVLTGRNPSTFFKLIKSGFGAMEMKTLFTDPVGNSIDWDMLKGVEMKYIPVLHIQTIYIGVKASIQIKMVSAIVTDVKARNTETTQLSTIRRLNAENPELKNRVAEQLAKLALRGNTKVSSINTAPDVKEEEEEAPPSPPSAHSAPRVASQTPFSAPLALPGATEQPPRRSPVVITTKKASGN